MAGTVNQEELKLKLKEIAALRLVKEKAKAVVSDADLKLKTLEAAAIDMINETGQENWRVKGVGLFTPSERIYPTITDQNKLQKYLKAHKLDNLIQIHPNTISEWAKAEMEKLKLKERRYLIDSVALAKTTMQKFGFSFYEKPGLNFAQREGKYKKIEKESKHG